jgi:hypothetical protein
MPASKRALEPDERWGIELLRRFEHANAAVSDHGAVEQRTIAELLAASHARTRDVCGN